MRNTFVIGLMIDEAHNVGGKTFEQVMQTAHDQAQKNRLENDLTLALDIFGSTAFPVTRIQRTVELFDNTDQSELLADLVGNLAVSLVQLENTKKALSFENLMLIGEFKVLKIVKQIDESREGSKSRSRIFRKNIVNLIN